MSPRFAKAQHGGLRTAIFISIKQKSYLKWLTLFHNVSMLYSSDRKPECFFLFFTLIWEQFQEFHWLYCTILPSSGNESRMLNSHPAIFPGIQGAGNYPRQYDWSITCPHNDTLLAITDFSEVGWYVAQQLCASYEGHWFKPDLIRTVTCPWTLL